MTSDTDGTEKMLAKMKMNKNDTELSQMKMVDIRGSVVDLNHITCTGNGVMSRYSGSVKVNRSDTKWRLFRLLLSVGTNPAVVYDSKNPWTQCCQAPFLPF